MYITNLAKTTKFAAQMEGAKDVFKQIPLSRENGAPVFSFRVFTVSPGGHTPYHIHPYEHMNYVISGEGALVTENGEFTVKEGDFALVLANEKHQYKNTSATDDFVMICGVPKDFE
ncbi:MAG: cupin domain-containing protein [Dehalococcoidales bacterium]